MFLARDSVVGRNPAPPGMYSKTLVNNGNYSKLLTNWFSGFLNHQQYMKVLSSKPLKQFFSGCRTLYEFSKCFPRFENQTSCRLLSIHLLCLQGKMTDRFYPVGMEVPMGNLNPARLLTILDASQIESFKTLGSIFVVRLNWIDLAVRNHGLRLLVFWRWWLQEIITETCDAGTLGIIMAFQNDGALGITTSQTFERQKHTLPNCHILGQVCVFLEMEQRDVNGFSWSMCWPQVLPISDHLPLQPSSPWCSFKGQRYHRKPSKSKVFGRVLWQKATWTTWKPTVTLLHHCYWHMKNHGNSQADADTWKTTYEVRLVTLGNETRMEF